MASEGKQRRERWTITAENELRKAVETRPGRDRQVAVSFLVSGSTTGLYSEGGLSDREFTFLFPTAPPIAG